MKDGCDLMRKGMKVFAALIAAATASAMSMTAFAASVSVGTTYSGDDVTVTADVTGAAANEEVAFLVHQTGATTYDNSTIYYIDQDTADEHGAVSFSFTDAKSKIITATGSTVRVGTASIANDSSLTDATTLKVNDFTITYSSGEHGTAYAIVSNAADTSGSVTTAGEVTFAVTADPGYTLDKVTVNGVEKEGLTLTDNLVTISGLTADAKVAFSFKAIETTVAASATTGTSGGSVSYAEGANNNVLARAKVAGSVKEAGMFISADSTALEAQKTSGKASIVESTSRIGKFKALAVGSDGSFAIELLEDMSGTVAEDYKQFITSTAMYGLAYAETDTGVIFGEVAEIK